MEKFKYIFIQLISIFLIALFTLLSWQNLTISTKILHNDYVTFYQSMHNHNDIYSVYYYTDNRAGLQHTSLNLNTPLMNVVIQKLVNFSNQLPVNTLLWVLIALLCATLSMRIFNFKHHLIILAALWISWPALFNSASGQISLFLLPLLCVGISCDTLKKHTYGAIVLSLLASLKLFFLIFALMYFVRRQWRLLMIFIISFFVFSFVPLMHFSWLDYQHFFELSRVNWEIINRSASPLNGTILGLVTNFYKIFKMQPSMIQIDLPATVLSVYVIVRWLFYDYRFLQFLPEFKNELRFSFLIVIGLLCSPLGWVYYYVFLLIPLIVIFKINQKYTLSLHASFYLICALFLPYFTVISVHGMVTTIIQHFCVFFSLLCWMGCLDNISKSVDDGNNQTSEWNLRMPVIIVLLYIACGIFLLSLNKGFPYYFDLDKTAYFQNVTHFILI